MPILNSARELDPARLELAVAAFHQSTSNQQTSFEDDIVAAILAYLSSGPERAVVKPLEWEETFGQSQIGPDEHVDAIDIIYWARASIGSLAVEYDHFTGGSPWQWVSGGKVMGHCDTVAEAKAAAQAYFEARILAHLETRPLSGPERAAEEMLAALKPFGELAEHFEKSYPEYADHVQIFYDLSHGDFRRVRAAIAAAQEQKPERIYDIEEVEAIIAKRRAAQEQKP